MVLQTTTGRNGRPCIAEWASPFGARPACWWCPAANCLAGARGALWPRCCNKVLPPSWVMSDPDGGHGIQAHGHEPDHDHEHEHTRSGLVTRLWHVLRPHSDEPADQVDAATEASAEGMRVLWISATCANAAGRCSTPLHSRRPTADAAALIARPAWFQAVVRERWACCLADARWRPENLLPPVPAPPRRSGRGHQPI
jgi:hypothetical protein